MPPHTYISSSCGGFLLILLSAVIVKLGSLWLYQYLLVMMKCYVAFGLFLSITVTVQNKCEFFSFVCLVDIHFLYIVTVTWQGVPVTGPLLIFHSEVQRTVDGNSLTCSHPTGPVAWYLTTGTRLTTQSSGTFIHVISNDRRQTQLRRGTNDREESQFDGLWTCRLNGATGAGAFHVMTHLQLVRLLSFQVDLPHKNSQFKSAFF